MLDFLKSTSVAVVIGATGGIGAALVAALRAESAVGTVVASGCRQVPDAAPGVVPIQMDLADEASIARAGDIAAALGEVRLVVVASGLLHGGDLAPEKTWKSLDAAHLVSLFTVNAIGPALVAKHFLPLLPRSDRAVFAALSARVGSIEDNRTGGWYGYRASKAALNMLISTLAIELRQRAPAALCVGLHPGTVETPLSAPFLRAVPQDRRFTPAVAAGHLLDVLDSLEPADSGAVLAWNGARVPA